MSVTGVGVPERLKRCKPAKRAALGSASGAQTVPRDDIRELWPVAAQRGATSVIALAELMDGELGNDTRDRVRTGFGSRPSVR
jgi:hypothetical protein